MHCPRCNTPLWKVRSRECPSCGRPFKPSDFRFRPDTVRFCCPHCSQGYLGKGADGLPDPRRFACAFCGETIDADEMVLEPAQGVEELQTRPDSIPWIETHRSWPARWGLTAWLGLTDPCRLMQITPPDLPVRSAVVFALVTQGVLAAGMVGAALVLGVLLSLPGGARAFGAFTGPGLSRLTLTLGLTAPFMSAWIVLAHGAARRCGREVTLARTMHALCFTGAPHALWYLPALGPYVGWLGTLAWVRSAARALGEGHSIAPRAAWRAAGAWPGACLLLTVVVWGAWTAGLLGRWGPQPAEWVASEAESVSGFAEPLREAVSRGGAPVHAGQLMADGRVPPGRFLAPGSRTTLADVEIAGVTLEQFEQLAPARRLAVIQQAAGRVQPGVPSHRLGDYVFVMDAPPRADASPGLRMVIEAWDPSLNETGGPVHVLHADGSVRSIPGDALPSALEEQNRLRRRAGLPALPDPRSVRDGLPAPGEG